MPKLTKEELREKRIREKKEKEDFEKKLDDYFNRRFYTDNYPQSHSNS